MFSILRNCQTIYQARCTTYWGSPPAMWWVPISLDPHQYCVGKGMERQGCDSWKVWGFFLVDANALKLWWIIKWIVQYMKNHWFAYIKWVNCRVYELYLKKAIDENNQSNKQKQQMPEEWGRRRDKCRPGSLRRLPRCNAPQITHAFICSFTRTHCATWCCRGHVYNCEQNKVLALKNKA